MFGQLGMMVITQYLVVVCDCHMCIMLDEKLII